MGMKKVLFQPSLPVFALLLTAAALQAQNAQNATLVVRADAECKLSVDGEAKGVLRPDDRMRIVLQLGEHLVEAVPTAGGKRWEQVVNLNEAKTQVLTISLPKAPAAPPAAPKTATTPAPPPPPNPT